MRGYSNIFKIFSDSIKFCRWCFPDIYTKLRLFDAYWGVLLCEGCFWTLEYCTLKVPFLISAGVILIFGNFFRLYYFLSRLCNFSSVPETKLWLFEWYRGVSLRVGCFGTLEYSRMKVQFLNIAWLFLYFSSFLRFYWFLSKTTRTFQLQRLIRSFLTDIEVSHLKIY